jgi:hypothetical protein
MSDNPVAPVIRYAAPIQTAVIWGSDRFLADTADTWVDLPGARIPQQVGQGTPSLGALFVAIFSAESLVRIHGDGVCLLDVTFGGREPHPVSDDHRFDSSAGPGTEWRSVTTTRVMEIPPTVSVVDATAQVRVQYKGGAIGECGLQNWTLTLLRYA